MGAHARMAHGAAGVGSDKRNPPPKGDAESEAAMRSSVHPAADPKSPHYDGSRCFRSRNLGLGLFLFVKPKRQVGDEVIPASHANLRFEPSGYSDYGELFVAKDDPDFDAKVARICGDGAKIKPHRYFLDGTIVDAAVAYYDTKKDKARTLIAALADPDVKEAVVAELGAETVSNFLAAATETAAVVKAKKPGKSTSQTN